MALVLRTVNGVCIAAEWQAEEVSAQVLEKRDAGEVRLLVLPEVEEIGLDWLVRARKECDWRMLPAQLGDEVLYPHRPFLRRQHLQRLEIEQPGGTGYRRLSGR